MEKQRLKLTSAKVEVEVEAEVVFHNADVLKFQFRCSLDFFHYLHGRVGGWLVGWEIGE